MALDYFVTANNWPSFVSNEKFTAEVCEQKQGTQKILLIKPKSYMNDSGQVVQKIAAFYKTSAEDTLVVYDELALPFGSVRIREGGSSAGHNGIKSLIEHLGDSFIRLRVGIDNDQSKKFDSKDFVLANFTDEEEGQLSHIFDYTNHVIHHFISSEKLEAHTEKTLPELI
jgi:PTH1 family peptidyl-tRNA hydrolase